MTTPVKQKEETPKEEKTGFTFDEKTHRYYLDGKAMTGVTTVLGVINKPALITWSANCAVDFIKAEIEKQTQQGLDIAGLAFGELFTDARTAHTRKRDTAAEQGTDIHAICEMLIKQAITYNKGDISLATPVLSLFDGQVLAFLKWAIKNKVIFTASEKKVYDAQTFVAGTLDFACEMDGLKYIGDIKTSSGIYGREPFAQTAAYQYLWSAMDKKKPEEIADRRLIINLKKTGTFDEDKDVHISEHYEDDIELFMSALTMYRNVGRFEALHYLAKRK